MKPITPPSFPIAAVFTRRSGPEGIGGARPGQEGAVPAPDPEELADAVDAAEADAGPGGTGGSSDDDDQPDDVGATGELGDAEP